MTPFSPRVNEVYKMGLLTFGCPQAFNEWLNEPCFPLGGKRPMHCMYNDREIEAVINVLGQIQHGIVN